MRITKFGHACVRIEHDGQVLVIDPGGWSEPEAVDGATAVLVTHEHPDHLSLENLRRTGAPVFTIDAVARQIADEDPAVSERVTVVAPGERPVITPSPSTTAMPSSPVVQSTPVTDTGVLPASRATTCSCTGCPTARSAVSGNRATVGVPAAAQAPGATSSTRSPGTGSPTA